TSILRSRPIHLLAHPVTAFMLNIGGMYVLYMTPLYAAILDAPVLHHLVHVHFFLAGYLFCWAILAGPDPAPRPTVMRFRLAVLFISIAAHAILGKLMYGYLLPRNTLHSVEEIQAAAQIIYYGGDFAELLLVIALFGMWYNKRTSRRYAFFSVS
ncbi:MAG: cytochrome c oxidase assembly protein, partial [Balneolales bacterium]